jgi:hypothetical protein
MRTLLAAEHEWLQRAIAQFQHQIVLERAESEVEPVSST